MSPAPLIRVLLVDDDSVVRETVSGYLRNAADLRLVGCASSGAEAVPAVRESAPDVILMDVRMPDTDGIEATREIVGRAPGTRVVALTSFEDDDAIADMLAAGAVGYVIKTDRPEVIVQAVRTAHLGLTVIPSNTAGRWAGDHVRLPATPELTERERVVLHLVGAGLANRQIADRMHLSTSSVKGVVATLLSRFAVRNRAQLVGRAHELGVREPRPGG